MLPKLIWVREQILIVRRLGSSDILFHTFDPLIYQTTLNKDWENTAHGFNKLYHLFSLFISAAVTSINISDTTRVDAESRRAFFSSVSRRRDISSAVSVAV